MGGGDDELVLKEKVIGVEMEEKLWLRSFQWWRKNRQSFRGCSKAKA